MTNRIFSELADFLNDKFPDLTVDSQFKKLENEMLELKQYPSDVMEYADCFLCLFGLAHSSGISFNELRKAIVEKMEIVKKRKWKKESDGTYQHID